MVKLTEDMIVARTRVSDLTHVKKLNCWGAELTDISVIRKLTNVEVLSLSVNSISTLADIQHCNNLQELYIRKNKIPEINEICWLKDLTRLRNLWLEENPFAEGSSEMYRLTVIKALPQLQKLDNVPVQSEEMADAMRRGLDLLHPLNSEGEGVTYNLQDRPQQREEPQEERRSSRGSHYEDERRESVVSQVQSPSRRVSNQVFDERVYTQHSPPQPPPGRRTSYQPMEDDMRRMSIREEANYAEDRQDRQNANNNYQDQVQQLGHHRTSYSGPPSSDGYRGPQSTPEAGGYMTRAQSQEQFRSPYRSPTEVGGASGMKTPPEGRGAVAAPPEGRGAVAAPPEGRGAPGRLSPPDLETLREESGRVSKVRNSSASDLGLAATKPNHAHSGSLAAPQEGQQGDVHAIVSQHYDSTYRQVHQQLESAHQLVAQRSQSPQRPYPARPKNRNSNVLSAILCLIKEIDGPSLEVVEMAVRCRMEELED